MSGSVGKASGRYGTSDSIGVWRELYYVTSGLRPRTDLGTCSHGQLQRTYACRGAIQVTVLPAVSIGWVSKLAENYVGDD